jgi:uncharacterized protein YlaI
MTEKTRCKKTYFANETQALLFIAKLKKTSLRERKPVNTYLCPHCLSWHLTRIELKEVKEVKYLKRQIENLKVKIERLQNEKKT